MDAKKILEVTALYRARFEVEGIPARRMDLDQFFSSKAQMLEHAHHLLGGIEEYLKDPGKQGKANRHLASVQVLLWVARWYTLQELMSHSRPDQEPQGLTTEESVIALKAAAKVWRELELPTWPVRGHLDGRFKTFEGGVPEVLELAADSLSATSTKRQEV